MGRRREAMHGTGPETTGEMSLRSWEKPKGPAAKQMRPNATVDMGWGKLIFAHTFDDDQKIIETLTDERHGRRHIAFYLRDPHVILSKAPDRLFLDPSHTYRMWAHRYRPSQQQPQGFVIRRIATRRDAEEINRIYAARQMVTTEPDFMLDESASRLRVYLVAESTHDGAILGTVSGVDHVEAFNDPEHGASLWCLAVDPQCQVPGVGQSLVRHLLEHFFARGRGYVDLSVMHNNTEAIALYEKLGFQRVPVFCVKHKNPINEPLFTPPLPEESLNPYAKIIVDEARRRGITVSDIDTEGNYFVLGMGGRSITCRESLTELTTAIAMSICDDKAKTRRVLEGAGLELPAQRLVDGSYGDVQFMHECGSVVVKPMRGEQGAGISVDVRDEETLQIAIDDARRQCKDVLLEAFVKGEDLRIIVINFEVVAAAVRRPPIITGTGRHTISQLIEKYNRRRAAATGGESRVPTEGETERCITEAGYSQDDILPAGETLAVRKTANLHTGGTIHDVTNRLHPTLADAAGRAAVAIDIPVVGMDLIVPDVSGDTYYIIEANERPGLANHEPQPTAEKFIDFLFPQTVMSRP
ncbi:MAG: N-acetylglutaminylglutamine synthetase [Phycisphaeraceae bacterium]